MQQSPANEIIDLCSPENNFDTTLSDCKPNAQEQMLELEDCKKDMFKVDCCQFGLVQLLFLELDSRNDGGFIIVK